MEYPKMLYRTESETSVVQDAGEEEKARSAGFGDYAELNNPDPQAPENPPSEANVEHTPETEPESQPEPDPQAPQEAAPAAEAPKKRR